MKKKTKKQLDQELIDTIESECAELDHWPCDESQTVSNAGDEYLYAYEGKQYVITVWNDRAVDHKPGSKTIALYNKSEDDEN
jgi:hypothetical protein